MIFEVGFMIYLNCVYNQLQTSSTHIMYESEIDEGEGDDDNQKETKEVGQEDIFSPSKEEKEAELLSLVALKCDISKTAQSTGELDIMSHELQLPIVPDFQIEGSWYILLSDVQKVFSIQEDYALAAIAKIAEQSDGFESDDSQEFLDLEENFDAVECL